MKPLEIDWVYKVNDTNVYWTIPTNGGGTSFLKDYFDYFKTYYPNKTFNNALDWCAGAGFIGFGVLACDICNHITLLEKFDQACELMHKTIKDGNIDNATVVHDDNIAVLKDKYDLIIGNPPHFRQYHVLQKQHALFHTKEDWVRIAVDKNWSIHREFFTNIKNKMTPDCLILLLENFEEVPNITQVANECGFVLKNKHIVESTVENENVGHMLVEFVLDTL